jgi:hypothetical protein
VVLPAGPNFALSPSIDDFIFICTVFALKYPSLWWVGCCLLKLPTDLPADIKVVTTFDVKQFADFCVMPGKRL